MPRRRVRRRGVDGLSIALDAFDASSAKVLVVSSSTPGIFAAGADIKQMENGDREAFEAFGVAFRAPWKGLPRIAVHRSPLSRASRSVGDSNWRWRQPFG
jgi:enoyl-CoA hydratase/carnithine racemase